MKVLLVSLDSKYIHSNAAVYSLKAYAERRSAHSHAGNIRKNDEIDVSIAEYTVNQPPQKVLADIYKHGAQVIMLSCYIWNIDFAERLIEDLAVVNPEAEIWLGGPEVSFDSENILTRHGKLRGIMIGEGEETFARLLKAYGKYSSAADACGELEKIEGIAFRNQQGKIVRTPDRAYMDMDEPVFAYENAADFENRIIYYESSRGCPFHCTYCLSSVCRRLRFRNTETVKRELKFFLDNKVKQVKFVDRTFNCSHERTMEIWSFLKANDNGVTNFHFEMAADMLNDEEIKLLNSLRAGQVQLEIGVQTTNPLTLKAIERSADFERLAKNVNAVKAAGNVHLHLDLIAGLPYEDITSFAKSFNDVFALRPEQLQLGFLKVLKGSPISERCEEFGIKHTEAAPYEVLKTKWLSYEDILKLKQVEEMVEVYYNTGQFSRSLELILGAFGNAFEMFAELGKWYAEQGLDMINLSRNSRYERLMQFGLICAKSESDDGLAFSDSRLREAVIIDYYSGENVKTRPEFLGVGEADKEFSKEFYSKEARRHEYLTGSELGSVSDPRVLRKHTHLEKTSSGYLLFDYTRKNAMTNSAMLINIDKQC